MSINRGSRAWRASRLALTLVAIVTTALLATRLSVLHPHRGLMPILFAIALVWLSSRYGVIVSLFGAPLVALIFAYSTAPLGSFRVESDAARSQLGWMVLGSIVVSYLIADAHPAERNR